MKTVKHIWKYLTSLEYRFWIDYCSRKEFLDRNMAIIERTLKLQAYPIFITDKETKRLGLKIHGKTQT